MINNAQENYRLPTIIPGSIWDKFKNAIHILLWHVHRLGRGVTFKYGKQTFPYFCHAYNRTWNNERAIEIPIALWFLNQARGRNVLEIGNVLYHYVPVEHDVVDKYETAENVIKEDIASFVPKKKYDLIISVSTMEHVGWDEQPQDPEKLALAMDRIPSFLSPGGQFVVTVPVGYNPHLDSYVRKNPEKFSQITGYRRETKQNDWVETPLSELWGVHYHQPFPFANGLLILVVRK